ncbi:ferritin [Candidatus Pacearchaeota archaeon]|nr:ferritin [Candidatus Pacearchaeota archaeon]
MLSTNYILSDILRKALDDQIEKELNSSCLYLSASHYFAINNLKGFALFFKKQSKEEYEHAERFISLFKKHRIQPSLERSFQPPTWKNTENILELSLSHEKSISTSIHDIYKIAESEGNVCVCEFLKWFVKEQLEEENSLIELNELYQYYSQKQAGLIDLDRLLAGRCETEDRNG